VICFLIKLKYEHLWKVLSRRKEEAVCSPWEGRKDWRKGGIRRRREKGKDGGEGQEGEEERERRVKEGTALREYI
jgi:ribosomal protein L15